MAQTQRPTDTDPHRSPSDRIHKEEDPEVAHGGSEPASKVHMAAPMGRLILEAPKNHKFHPDEVLGVEEIQYLPGLSISQKARYVAAVERCSNSFDASHPDSHARLEALKQWQDLTIKIGEKVKSKTDANAAQVSGSSIQSGTAQIFNGKAALPRIELSPDIRAELIKLGALEQHSAESAATPPEMVGPIHPLFAYQNWLNSELALDEWNTIRPALVLATRFITPGTCLFDFFVRVTHATHRLAGSGPNEHVYLDKLDINADISLQTAQVFADMATVVRFAASRKWLGNGTAQAQCYEPMDFEHTPLAGCRPRDAERLPYREWQKKLDHYIFPENHGIPIVLHEFLIKEVVAARVGRTNESVHRACFCLAVTLVHELAHATWRFTRSPEYRDRLADSTEPRITRNFEAPASIHGEWELGHQWEMYICNCMPSAAVALPIANINESSLVPIWLPDSLVMCSFEDGGEMRDFLFGTAYVVAWFKQETWDAIRLFGWLAVPKMNIGKTCGKFVLRKRPDGSGICDLVLKN